MDIKTREQSLYDIAYGDDSFDTLLDQLKSFAQSSSFHICLFVGKPDKSKQEARDDIEQATGQAILEIDANDLITKSETHTYKNINRLFKDYDPKKSILYVNNGTRFSGVYTGNTQSRVKYATPQERYFLKKIQQVGGLFIIDIQDIDDADMTMHRAAQSVVTFETPQSMFSKLFWKLKHVSTHGYQIKSKRPERYTESGSNF